MRKTERDHFSIVPLLTVTSAIGSDGTRSTARASKAGAVRSPSRARSFGAASND